MRWVQLRQQASSGGLSPGKKAQALQAIDARLQEVCRLHSCSLIDVISTIGIFTRGELLHTSMRH